MDNQLKKESIRQSEIHTIIKNRAFVRNWLLFWDSPLWRIIYNRVLKHRFTPREVLMRYEIFSERKLIKKRDNSHT